MATATESSKSPDTYFAPAGRDKPEEFARRRTVVQHSPLLCEALNAIHDMVLILNEHRQIVAANAAALRMLQATAADLVAKRPGEAVGCVWSKAGPDGCGTEQHCVTCGAVNAILESQNKNIHVVRECRIRVDGPSGPSSLDLKVAATPITVESERFIVLAIEDISQPKRLEVLQRVFFHDVLNTAGCISGYAAYLMEERTSIDETCSWLVRLSEELIEEIQAQRELLAAEAGDLPVQTDMVITRQLLDELQSHYLKNPVAAGRSIEFGNVWAGVVWTDRRLLLRVLGNMLKNGLEATPQNQVVSLHCQDQGEAVVFAIHNPGVIPVEAQLQIFQRSFSTKGLPGRGIGTYSMKLFGERYLGGRVDFISREPEGTTFTLTLPKKTSAQA
jgi:K+-sensing histidine kinase KdpD